MESSERLHIQTSPSQMVNIGHFLGALAAALLGAWVAMGLADARAMVFLGWLAVVIGYAAWRYLVIDCTVYEVSSERIKSRSGVLNKTVDELELYRVRDYQIQQPFWLRMVGCGNVVVVSADRTTGVLVLWAVKDSEKIANTLRALVEKTRKSRGVRDMDVGPAPTLDD